MKLFRIVTYSTVVISHIDRLYPDYLVNGYFIIFYIHGFAAS